MYTNFSLIVVLQNSHIQFFFPTLKLDPTIKIPEDEEPVPWVLMLCCFWSMTFHTSRFLSSQTSPSPAPPHFRLMILPFYLQVTPSTHLSFGCSNPQLLLRGFSQAIASFPPAPPIINLPSSAGEISSILTTNSLLTFLSLQLLPTIWCLDLHAGGIWKKKKKKTELWFSPLLTFSFPNLLISAFPSTSSYTSWTKSEAWHHLCFLHLPQSPSISSVCLLNSLSKLCPNSSTLSPFSHSHPSQQCLLDCSN